MLLDLKVLNSIILLKRIQFLGFLLPWRQWESEVTANLGERESPSLTWCLSFLHAFMLSLHLGGMLGLAYPKEQVENLLNRRRRLVSLLPTPPSSPRR
jgi:hypothetical protein